MSLEDRHREEDRERRNEQARTQAQVEMEKQLVAQEQQLEHDTGVPIDEQADGDPADSISGVNVITADEGAGEGRMLGGRISERRTIESPDVPAEAGRGEGHRMPDDR